MMYRRVIGWVLVTIVVALAGGTGYITGEVNGYQVGINDGVEVGVKFGYEVGYLDGALGVPPATIEEEIVL